MTNVPTLIRLLILLLLAGTAGACAARSGVPHPFPGAATPPSAAEPAPPVVEAPALPDLVHTALGFRGVPYVNGGSDPSGFDCSGFMQYVFSQHGTALPREVRDQYQVGHRVRVNDVQPGDLLFFQTVSRGASHVGMAIGGGEFVHAPSSRGVVRVERYGTPYWASRLIGVRRIVETGPSSAPSARAGFPGAIGSSR